MVCSGTKVNNYFSTAEFVKVISVPDSKWKCSQDVRNGYRRCKWTSLRCLWKLYDGPMWIAWLLLRKQRRYAIFLPRISSNFVWPVVTMAFRWMVNVRWRTRHQLLYPRGRRISSTFLLEIVERKWLDSRWTNRCSHANCWKIISKNLNHQKP